MIGYAFCGSFCTLEASLKVLVELKDLGEEIIPIMSERVISTNTRFGTAEHFISASEKICGNKVVTTVDEAERFGSIAPLDYLVISPCTGNTLAKLAMGITDGVVTMAAKAHLRCDRPLLIALSTNDAMSQNLKNIGTLLSRKNVYFAPMLQDDPIKKPHSLVSEQSLIMKSYLAMKRGEQLRPIFL